MKINLLFTGIYILILILSVYFQFHVSSRNIRKGMIIPLILILTIVFVWIANGFEIIKCFPITIILGFICIIDALICLFLYHNINKVDN